MKENNKFIIIDGKLIEVTQEVYEAYYKSLRKERYFMQDLKVGTSKIDPDTGDVEEEVLHKMLMESLHRALEQLKSEEKELIWNLYFEEISEVELARRIGIGRTTLQYRKYQVQIKKFVG